MDRVTGKRLTGWPLVLQSIIMILTTPIGSRVERRDFGSELPDLVDRPLTPAVVAAIYAATVNAIVRWEPRFKITGVLISAPNEKGSLGLIIQGDYLGQVVQGQVSL